MGCHFLLQCMKLKSESEVAESCPTLSDPMDFGPPGSSVHGIFQARVLEWGAIAFSEATTTIRFYMYHESETEDVSCSVMFNFFRPPGLDCSPPISSVHGIFQARVLEWDAIAFSKY